MLSAKQDSRISVADAAAWQPPVLDDANVRAGGRRLSTEQLREEQRRVLAEAETAGRAAGLAAAQKEIDARHRELDEQSRALQVALDALARPLAQVDDLVHRQIAMLALEVARGLLRRELRTDPSQIIAIVRETVGLLPASARGVRVALHPDDAALVRERLVVSGPEAAWSVVDDPALTRGDCRVFTEYAHIDARIATQLNEALIALLGDERTQPRGGEEA
jgi:flagellar assembly protein FliH